VQRSGSAIQGSSLKNLRPTLSGIAVTAGRATAPQIPKLSVLSAFSAVKMEMQNRKERKDRKEATTSKLLSVNSSVRTAPNDAAQ